MNENYTCPKHGKPEKIIVDIHGSRIIARLCPICEKELIKEED